MVVLGLFGILQVIFLPGYIFLDFLHVRLGKFQKILYVFALSLILNYGIVLILSLFGLYNRAVILSIIGCELLIIFFRHFIALKAYMTRKIISDLSKKIVFINGDIIDFIENSDKKNVTILSLLFTLIMLVYLLRVMFITASTEFAFFMTDDVGSWAYWAAGWATGIVPKFTYHYPQLIPINFSIIYVVLGQEIQYFAKVITPLFSLGIFALCIDLAFHQKKAGYLIGGCFTVLLLRNFYGQHGISSGYADIPVAFMTFLVVYLFLRRDSNFTSINKHLFLAIIFTCGAAVTKQAGFITYIMFPVLVCFFLIRFKKRIELSFSMKKLIFLYLGLLATLVLPFYLVQEAQIACGNNASEIQVCTQAVHEDSLYIPRALKGLKMFLTHNLVYTFYNIGTCVNQYLYLFLFIFITALYLLMLLFGICRNKDVLFIFFILGLPNFILWLLLFSYDQRNLHCFLPFYGIATGFGMYELLPNNFFKAVARIPIWLGLVPIIGGILFLNQKYTSDFFYQKQIHSNLQYGVEGVNRALFNYISRHEMQGCMLTNISFAYVIGLKNISHYVYPINQDTSLEDINSVICNKNIRYFLYPAQVMAHIMQALQAQNIASDTIFDKDGYLFIKI